MIVEFSCWCPVSLLIIKFGGWCPIRLLIVNFGELIRNVSPSVYKELYAGNMNFSVDIFFVIILLKNEHSINKLYDPLVKKPK